MSNASQNDKESGQNLGLVIPSNQAELLNANDFDEERVAVSKALHERAIALARSPNDENKAGECLEVAEFILSKEHYGIETAYLREIHPVRQLAVLPGAPSFVSGLVSIRGQIIVVINLKVFFDLPDDKCNERKQVLIVESEGRKVGFLADAVQHIRRFPLDDLRPPLPTLTGVKSEFIRGITNDRIVLLDANRVINSEKILINDNDIPLNSSITPE